MPLDVNSMSTWWGGPGGGYVAQVAYSAQGLREAACQCSDRNAYRYGVWPHAWTCRQVTHHSSKLLAAEIASGFWRCTARQGSAPLYRTLGASCMRPWTSTAVERACTHARAAGRQGSLSLSRPCRVKCHRARPTRLPASRPRAGLMEACTRAV